MDSNEPKILDSFSLLKFPFCETSKDSTRNERGPVSIFDCQFAEAARYEIDMLSAANETSSRQAQELIVEPQDQLAYPLEALTKILDNLEKKKDIMNLSSNLDKLLCEFENHFNAVDCNENTFFLNFDIYFENNGVNSNQPNIFKTTVKEIIKILNILLRENFKISKENILREELFKISKEDLNRLADLLTQFTGHYESFINTPYYYTFQNKLHKIDTGKHLRFHEESKAKFAAVLKRIIIFNIIENIHIVKLFNATKVIQESEKHPTSESTSDFQSESTSDLERFELHLEAARICLNEEEDVEKYLELVRKYNIYLDELQNILNELKNNTLSDRLDNLINQIYTNFTSNNVEHEILKVSNYEELEETIMDESFNDMNLNKLKYSNKIEVLFAFSLYKFILKIKNRPDTLNHPIDETIKNSSKNISLQRNTKTNNPKSCCSRLFSFFSKIEKQLNNLCQKSPATAQGKAPAAATGAAPAAEKAAAVEARKAAATVSAFIPVPPAAPPAAPEAALAVPPTSVAGRKRKEGITPPIDPVYKLATVLAEGSAAEDGSETTSNAADWGSEPESPPAAAKTAPKTAAAPPAAATKQEKKVQFAPTIETSASGADTAATKHKKRVRRAPRAPRATGAAPAAEKAAAAGARKAAATVSAFISVPPPESPPPPKQNSPKGSPPSSIKVKATVKNIEISEATSQQPTTPPSKNSQKPEQTDHSA